MKITKSLLLKTILTLVAVFSLITFKTQIAQANDTGAEFSVNTLQNENQVDQNEPYFDLKLNPNQKTDLAVNVINDSDDEQTFTVMANDALTNSNLIIDYSPFKNSKKQLVNPKIGFSAISSPSKQKVTVPAHSFKKVTIKVQAPSDKFDGTILGGIYVRKELKSMVKNGYTNRFNFATAVVINRNGGKSVKIPDLKLKKASFKSDDMNNQVIASLQNSSNVYQTKLKTETKIYKQGNSSKPLVNQTNDDRSIAPNTKFDYTIPLNKAKVGNGKYILDLTITNPKTGKVWHWKEPFEVSRTDSVKANPYVKTVKTIPFIYWVYAVLLLLIVILLLVLIFKKKKNK